MPEPRAIVYDKGIRPGLNSTGADIAKSVFVQLVAAGTEDPNQVQLPSGAGVAIYGVTMGIIKNGQIGDIQVEGRAKLLAGAGGLAVGGKVATTTAGAGVTAATTNIVVAKCVAAAAAASIAEVELVAAAQSQVLP
jgi:hypothetical protein